MQGGLLYLLTKGVIQHLIQSWNYHWAYIALRMVINSSILVYAMVVYNTMVWLSTIFILYLSYYFCLYSFGCSLLHTANFRFVLLYYCIAHCFVDVEPYVFCDGREFVWTEGNRQSPIHCKVVLWWCLWCLQVVQSIWPSLSCPLTKWNWLGW